MNEWKELKTDNLPPDILTGDYEFEYNDCYPDSEWGKSSKNGVHVIFGITDMMMDNRGYGKYRYRRPKDLTEIYLLIDGEKHVIDCNNSTEKFRKNIENGKLTG